MTLMSTIQHLPFGCSMGGWHVCSCCPMPPARAVPPPSRPLALLPSRPLALSPSSSLAPHIPCALRLWAPQARNKHLGCFFRAGHLCRSLAHSVTATWVSRNLYLAAPMCTTGMKRTPKVFVLCHLYATTHSCLLNGTWTHGTSHHCHPLPTKLTLRLRRA
jgi:hypothetical protein